MTTPQRSSAALVRTAPARRTAPQPRRRDPRHPLTAAPAAIALATFTAGGGTNKATLVAELTAGLAALQFVRGGFSMDNAFFQIDLYHTNNDTAALIAGGVLYGPNNPTEPLAHGAVAGDPWKYLTTAPCVPKPEPRPFSDSASTSDCEWTTTITRTGFFESDFDPIGNVWTERTTPTITAETSSKAPVSASDLVAACSPAEQLPTLADTGVEPYDGWLMGGMGAALILAGVAIVAGLHYRRRNQSGGA